MSQKAWSKRGVILEKHSFGTKYTLIEQLLQQLSTPSDPSRPQEDKAGAPTERYPSYGNNNPSPAHHVLALHASGHFSYPSPPISSSVPTTQNTIIYKRWKHYQDK